MPCLLRIPSPSYSQVSGSSGKVPEKCVLTPWSWLPYGEPKPFSSEPLPARSSPRKPSEWGEMEWKQGWEERESGPRLQAFCKHFTRRRIYCFLAWQEHRGLSPAVEGGAILQHREGKGCRISRQRRHSAAPALPPSLQPAKGIQEQD